MAMKTSAAPEGISQPNPRLLLELLSDSDGDDLLEPRASETGTATRVELRAM